MTGTTWAIAAGVAVLVAAAGAFWWWWRRRRLTTPMHSLVLFHGKPRQVTPQQVVHALAARLGVQAGLNEPRDGAVVVEAPFGVAAMFDKWGLAIQNCDRPYFDDPERVADELGDLRTRDVLLACRAWTSVDLMGPLPRGKTVADAMAIIGKLLGAFADESTIAVYSPKTGRCCAISSELLARIACEDPLAVLEQQWQPPVVGVEPDDSELAAAVEQARLHWDEFVRDFEARSEGDEFVVKAKFCEGEYSEFMWFAVSALEEGIVYGKLLNSPIWVKSLSIGDRVHVKEGDVVDFAYLRDGKPCGGFTVELLDARRRSAAADQ